MLGSKKLKCIKLISCGLFRCCGSNFSMLFPVPLMPGFTHHERKTFYKSKQELAYLLTLEIKSAHNLQTLWAVALWAYLRSGSTQSECFSNHWPAHTSYSNGLQGFHLLVFFVCLFFKLQFTIGKNILDCDLVCTVYRVFNQNNILETIFDLAPFTALFFSIPLLRYSGLELLNWLHGPLMG